MAVLVVVNGTRKAEEEESRNTKYVVFAASIMPDDDVNAYVPAPLLTVEKVGFVKVPTTVVPGLLPEAPTIFTVNPPAVGDPNLLNGTSTLLTVRASPPVVKLWAKSVFPRVTIGLVSVGWPRLLIKRASAAASGARARKGSASSGARKNAPPGPPVVHVLAGGRRGCFVAKPRANGRHPR
ncbi:MAG: hypothetical protein F4094_08900 [Synechococcus sp. SB0672_bin_6]|nr:hypothetical protein [Synechococcus sp. SB0672_bin_6]